MWHKARGPGKSGPVWIGSIVVRLAGALYLALGCPLAAIAQQACQPLQGTPAHATCLNEQLSRQADPDLRALEQSGVVGRQGFVAPDLHLSQRDRPPVPAYSPDFQAGQAAERLRLQQSTQARARALSGSITRTLAPRIGPPRY